MCCNAIMVTAESNYTPGVSVLLSRTTAQFQHGSVPIKEKAYPLISFPRALKLQLHSCPKNTPYMETTYEEVN